MLRHRQAVDSFGVWVAGLHLLAASTSDFVQSLFCAHQLAAKTHLRRFHTECQAHQLGEENDRHFVFGLKYAVIFILVSIQVHLAHRAYGDHQIGFILVSRCNQASDQLESRAGSDLGHVTAAAVRFQGKVDHLCAQRLQQAVQLIWVLVV